MASFALYSSHSTVVDCSGPGELLCSVFIDYNSFLFLYCLSVSVSVSIVLYEYVAAFGVSKCSSKRCAQCEEERAIKLTSA